MKIKLTYTDQERAAFERVRAELLQTLPDVRQHRAERHSYILLNHLQKVTFCGIIL